MRGSIYIQNDNNELFRRCLVRFLNPVNKNSGKVRNTYREFWKQLNFKGVK